MASDSFERETVNNQKRIIRELKRIADAIEALNKDEKLKNGGITLADYLDNGQEATEKC